MNILPRKFYDVAAAEPAATEIAATETKTEPTIAELMAKTGKVTNGDEPAPVPVHITKPTEKKEDKPTKATESTPAATATDDQSASKANSSSTEPKVEPKVEAKPEIPAPAPKVQSLEEVLKLHQPEAVLKALGIDGKLVNLAKKIQEVPEMAALYNHWQDKGDLKEYTRELSTDYSKMPAEEVMRHQLRREYPKASEAALNAIYKKEVTQAYNLDSEDAEESAEGKLLLEAKADRYRDDFVENQKKFLVPERPEPKAEPEPENTLEKQVNTEIETHKTAVLNDEFTKGVFSNKAITMGDGDDKFSFPVESPQALIDAIYDPEKFVTHLFKQQVEENGETKLIPDIQKQIMLGGLLVYGDDFLKEYAKHFKSLGGKAINDDIENASQSSKSTATKSEAAPTSVAEAMAKSGKVTYGAGQ